MARKVHISNRPLPSDKRSYGRSSGKIPYFEGLNSALCTPMAPNTIRGRTPPTGFTNRARVPIAINTTSRAFITTMTVRLLKRSENTPATIDTSISGSVKTTKVRVVWAWKAASNSWPDPPISEATCLMAKKATINFQALSLKAPKNCAMKRPRKGR